MKRIFLHGLESSSQGTKARWFRHHFPDMLIPDFVGTLDERMAELDKTIPPEEEDLVLVGSSFGGLMAAIYALEQEDRVHKVVLLAPALNFEEFTLYKGRNTSASAYLYSGRRDEVCPPEVIVPLAFETFTNLTVHESDDDHLLTATFPTIDWHTLLAD